MNAKIAVFSNRAVGRGVQPVRLHRAHRERGAPKRVE
jgi:hypothetical protein